MGLLNNWPGGTRPASRRAALREAGLGSVGLVAAFALACGGDNDNSKDSAPSGDGANSGAQPGVQGQPKRGGTHTVSQTTSYSDVMDPHTSLNQAPFLWSYVGNTALRLNRDATELVPELVEKWEIPSDGSEIILKIRQNVKWHERPPINGRAFDAEDLAYNLMRIAGKLNPNDSARFQRRSNLEGMNRAEAVDGTTVRVVFDRPASSFLNGLTDFRNQLVPRDFLDKGGKFEDPTSLVGTGPFTADSWKDNERATWKRNPAYWKAERPYLEAITWVWIPDKLSQMTALAKGDIDVIFSPTKADRDVLKKTVPDGQEEKWQFANWNHLRFNTERKPLDDPRIRRAIHLALNYKTMGDAFYGDGYWDYTGPCSSSFAEGFQPDAVAKLPGWNPSTKDADSKTAKDLMTAAGFPDGALNVKFLLGSQSTASSYYDFSIRAIDQLKQVWPAMKAEVDVPPDGATFSKRQVQGDFDIIAYVIFPQPDAVLDMLSQYHSTGSRNYGKFRNDRVDSMLNTAFSQLDRNQRTTTLQGLQNLLIGELMPIITVNSPRITTYTRGRVRGMKDFGGRADGGTYDFYRHTEGMWLA